MESLIIEKEKKTPGVSLDSETGLMEINGRSIPENPHAFFDPIIQWVKQYSQSPKPETVFNIFVDYMNTSSSKYVLEIFKELENLHKSDQQTTLSVNWIYYDDDDDSLEAGEEYQLLFSLPITLKPTT